MGWGSAGSADCETGADGAVAGGWGSKTALPTPSFLSVLRVTYRSTASGSGTHLILFSFL